jgi:phenylacetate-CoA ligase
LSAEVDHAALRATVAKVLHDNIGIRIDVEVLPAGSVPRSEGKAVRVVDRRGA